MRDTRPWGCYCRVLPWPVVTIVHRGNPWIPLGQPKTYLFGAEQSDRTGKWRIHKLTESLSNPKDSKVVFFMDMLQHGVRLSLQPHVQRILAHLGYASGQYNPNFWVALIGANCLRVTERGHFIIAIPTSQKSWRNRWVLLSGDWESPSDRPVRYHIPTTFQIAVMDARASAEAKKMSKSSKRLLLIGEPTYEQFSYLYSVTKSKCAGHRGWFRLIAFGLLNGVISSLLYQLPRSLGGIGGSFFPVIGSHLRTGLFVMDARASAEAKKMSKSSKRLLLIGEPTYEQFSYLYSVTKSKCAGHRGLVQANCLRVTERGHFIIAIPTSQKSWRNRWVLLSSDWESPSDRPVRYHIPTTFQIAMMDARASAEAKKMSKSSKRLLLIGEPTYEQFSYLYSVTKSKCAGHRGLVQANCLRVTERGHFIIAISTSQKSWRNRWVLLSSDWESPSDRPIRYHIPTTFQIAMMDARASAEAKKMSKSSKRLVLIGIK
ncbi:unnamed protein product [Prunus armeniaca]